jgi:RHH-type proline utilization regulon transcriptional repressor/proline dehydrogenase/delta 1-pyrroline-5-carboxylate dehydrogenase
VAANGDSDAGSALSHEAVSTDLTLAWAAASAAQLAWADTPLDTRMAVLQALGRSLPEPAAQALSAALAAGAAALAPHALPGPTGERNTLRLHGRGVLACVATGARTEALATTLATALLAGNSVMVLADGDAARTARQMASAVQAAGLPGAALQVQAGGPATLAAVLTHPSLAGVCFAVADAAREHTVQRALAQRPGAILPLITAAESMSPQQRYRFCTEQTLTVNTAAAGGNVELMAGPAAR